MENYIIDFELAFFSKHCTFGKENLFKYRNTLPKLPFTSVALDDLPFFCFACKFMTLFRGKDWRLPGPEENTIAGVWLVVDLKFLLNKVYSIFGQQTIPAWKALYTHTHTHTQGQWGKCISAELPPSLTTGKTQINIWDRRAETILQVQETHTCVTNR